MRETLLTLYLYSNKWELFQFRLSSMNANNRVDFIIPTTFYLDKENEVTKLKHICHVYHHFDYKNKRT